MNREPIRHHYIPQFILRNFCFNDNNDLYYYDKESQETTIRNTRDVFMEKNLYRDETNHSDNPTKIESDLSRFENEISQIINGKFLKGREITLTFSEEEGLKIFFAIMGFRSKNASNFFGKDADKHTKAFYSNCQSDGNLTDLWKRNLGHIVNCRTIEEILTHEKIDNQIKIFFHRDTVGITGMYFVVVERKENEDFVIGDSYPVIVNGLLDNGVQLQIYSIFPISPSRVILLVSNGAEATPRDVVYLRRCVFTKPKIDYDNMSITIRVKGLYNEEVRHLNSMVVKNAQEGIAFQKKINSEN
ncbi:MAG: DUF4238 domain-containing protein [Clostridia bacterium]|nr:DUF4238 domain-containing protein [Clostridia bacterium]